MVWCLLEGGVYLRPSAVIRGNTRSSKLRIAVVLHRMLHWILNIRIELQSFLSTHFQVKDRLQIPLHILKEFERINLLPFYKVFDDFRGIEVN